MQKAQRKKRERKGRKVLQIAYPLKKGPSDFFVGKVSVHEIPLTTRSARPSVALDKFLGLVKEKITLMSEFSL